MDLTYILIAVPLIVIVVIVVAVALVNRGKQLKCPDCGKVFNAPAMDEKMMGIGWSLPYMGTVKCPNCGKKRSRKDYEKVKQQPTKP